VLGHGEYQARAGQRCAGHEHVVVSRRHGEQECGRCADRCHHQAHRDQVAHEPLPALRVAHRVLADPDGGQAGVGQDRDDHDQRADRHEAAEVDDPEMPGEQRGGDQSEREAGEIPDRAHRSPANDSTAGLGTVEDVRRRRTRHLLRGIDH
jgi:hypothetical protein